MNKSPTHITQDHIDAFNALRNKDFDNFCLTSCYVNGTPATAIAIININSSMTNDQGKPKASITPLFVSITPDMKLIRHTGKDPVTVDKQPITPAPETKLLINPILSDKH